MWRLDRPLNPLDEIASDFLERHGSRIDAEPERQVFSHIGRPRRRNGGAARDVPLAAFFDIVHTASGACAKKTCPQCSGPTSASSRSACQRCRRRASRARFIEKWNKRSGDCAALLDAILLRGGWGSALGERITIAPTATEEEEISALKEAFADAIHRNAEPEDFRAILIAFGFVEFIEARDARQAEIQTRRAEGVAEACRTPEARERTRRRNRQRWADPEERERLAEHNRRQWQDPDLRAKRSKSIKEAHSAPERRKFYSDLRKAAWADPEYRERATAATGAAKRTPEAREKFSALLRERWKDPVWRQKWMRANVARSAAAAEKTRGQKQDPDHVKRRLESRSATLADRRGRGEKIKQSPEVVANRVLKTRATKAAKRAALGNVSV